MPPYSPIIRRSKRDRSQVLSVVRDDVLMAESFNPNRGRELAVSLSVVGFIPPLSVTG